MKKKVVLELDLWTLDAEYEEVEDWDGHLFLQEKTIETEPSEEDVKKEIPRFFEYLTKTGSCSINGIHMNIVGAKIED